MAVLDRDRLDRRGVHEPVARAGAGVAVVDEQVAEARHVVLGEVLVEGENSVLPFLPGPVLVRPVLPPFGLDLLSVGVKVEWLSGR